MVREGGPQTASDGEGLTLTISAAGHASWILRYRLHGKRREYTLGPLTEWSLKEARGEAERLRKGIARGESPRKRTDGLETFEVLARQWHERINKSNAPAKQRQTIALLENHIFPKLGDLPLDKIKPSNVAEVVYAMLDKDIGRSANVARQVMKRVLSYGVALGLIKFNPAASIDSGVAGYKQKARDRALDSDELRIFLHALDEQKDCVGWSYCIAYKLLLLTGARKMELVNSKWSEFDLDTAMWTIPQERTKSRRMFITTLSRQAVELLHMARTLSMGASWVFPRADGSGPISNATLNRVLTRLSTPLERFTIHDLRRSMRSGLSHIGIEYAVAERCLNHQLPGLAATYDRADLLPQRREALQGWADYLDSIVNTLP